MLAMISNKGRRSFDGKQIENFISLGRTQPVCLQCRKADVEKERRLRKLVGSSRRKGCTCGTRLQHKERCPMNPRHAGERPYPGCDKMSKEESDWLAKRRRPRE